MNAENHSNDDMMIDRLVDDELSGDDRRRLLTALDAQPDGWRRCALAFVEAQTWQIEMRSLVHAAAESSKAERAAIAPSTVGGPSLRSSPSWIRYSGAWLATAAGLMIAFGLGRQLGSGERAALTDAQFADADKPAGSEVVIHHQERVPTGDAVTLVVNDHRGVSHRLNVPLIEGRRLGEQFAETPAWSSPELVRQFDERGLDLEARRRYAPMYFEQRDQLIPMVVPVDDAIVTPVSRPVY